MSKHNENIVGIRVNSVKDSIKARDEFINGETKGLVADLGGGYFVIRNETVKHLENKKISFKRIDIVDGAPKHVKEHHKKKYGNPITFLPF